MAPGQNLYRVQFARISCLSYVLDDVLNMRHLVQFKNCYRVQPVEVDAQPDVRIFFLQATLKISMS